MNINCGPMGCVGANEAARIPANDVRIGPSITSVSFYCSRYCDREYVDLMRKEGTELIVSYWHDEGKVYDTNPITHVDIDLIQDLKTTNIRISIDELAQQYPQLKQIHIIRTHTWLNVDIIEEKENKGIELVMCYELDFDPPPVRQPPYLHQVAPTGRVTRHLKPPNGETRPLYWIPRSPHELKVRLEYPNW